ncbi:28S ribosomal protein S29, mitochondrial [Cotesia glomerata]|uniref:28S ribosomal protein S29, mitochondrial n=1 Tax=Cotesia glomerata TaxID=32391 RepID=UPI001D033A35|nr:28S ribosomal protein S29, mitochondrial [Cotesia glomerata]
MIPTRMLLRRMSNNVRHQSILSQRAEVQQEEPIRIIRTTEDNPQKHNRDHLNRFYTVPKNAVSQVMPRTSMPRRLHIQIKTFREACIMVREPAIELISYLEQTDYSKPPNKYVLYGPVGSGKTLTLMHLLHYGYVTQKILVHIPWIPDWFRKRGPSNPCQRVEGLFDLPVAGAQWLVRFKSQNNHLLSKLDIRLSKNYVWNTREQNSAGTPLQDMIDFGIGRGKYTCDVIDALLKELKIASTSGHCNTLVLLDGVNAFFGEDTRVKDSTFKPLYAQRVSLTQSFLDFIKYDWCNGAIIATVDSLAVKGENQFDSTYPRFLLGKLGFEHLDPFLPIEVPNYSEDEFDAAIEYLKDRIWIRNLTEAGKRELELLSNRNPYKLMRLTASI